MSSDNGRVRKDYHESYYEHNCVVLEEKDVLKTDLPGHSWHRRLQRWWFGLFLLSYSDERVRIFYTSSHAMKMERLRQFRKYRSRIHPLSKFRNFWDCFILFVFLENRIVFHHNTSLVYGQISRVFYYVGAASELFIIADVYVNMMTGWADQQARRVVLDRREVLHHYCAIKLFFHVISAIPVQCMMFIRYGHDIDCVLCKTNKFIGAIKVISIFGFLRIFECSKYLIRERSSFNFTHFLRFLRIFVLGVYSMLEYLDLCDFFVLMKMVENNKIDERSYISSLIRAKFAVENPPSNYEFFIYNFARICKSVFLFSFSEVRIKYHIDLMVSLFAYLLANFFIGWFLLEYYIFIYRNHFIEDKVIVMKQSMDNMVRHRQLPDKVNKKLWKYFDFRHSKMKAMEQQNTLYTTMPAVLKKEAFLASYVRQFKRIKYFSEWPTNMIEDIVLMMKEEIYLKNDMVAEPWVESEGLFVVASGELAVFARGEVETGHLIDGDYFGELSLVTDREVRSSSVVAVNFCVILLLAKGRFRTYMRRYPELFAAMRRNLMEQFDSKHLNEKKE